MPSKQRNVTSMALQLEGTTWLMDCGEATQHQMLHTTLKPRKVSAIWISHLHGDHLFGLPGFLSTRSALDGTTPLTLYGPKGIKKWIEATLKVSGSHLRYELDVVEFEDGTTIVQDGHRVTVRALAHRFPSFGFRIEAPKRPGTLLVEKVKALGVPSGPLYRRIKEDARFEFEGNWYESSEYVSEPVKGNILAILGDTTPCPNARVLAQDADVLVHEATFMESEATLAHQYGHSTTLDAARLASASNVRQLIVTHISARYVGKETLFLQEVTAAFPETIVAVDFFEWIVGD